MTTAHENALKDCRGDWEEAMRSAKADTGLLPSVESMDAKTERFFDGPHALAAFSHGWTPLQLFGWPIEHPLGRHRTMVGLVCHPLHERIVGIEAEAVTTLGPRDEEIPFPPGVNASALMSRVPKLWLAAINEETYVVWWRHPDLKW